MEKCDVCRKTTLLPERFGSINICKVCFIKANGPFWKRSYDRFEDAQKQQKKALEAAQKQSFPQLVLSAIDDYFIDQIESMKECDCCHHPVMRLHSIGPLEKASICSRCFSKVNISAWNESNYEDNDAVETNRKKVLKIASRNCFPALVIEGINDYFDNKLQKGLICVINGGVGQTLKVFDTHCILITTDSFDTEEMSKRYGKALKNSRTNGTSFTSTAAKALAFGALIPGGTLVQTGLRAAASAAISVVADKFISGKGVFKVIKGNFRIDYTSCTYADYSDCGSKENDVGFIRFCRTNEPNDDIVFLFRTNQAKVKQAYPSICQGIEASHKPQTIVQEIHAVAQSTQSAPISVADELLKFKQLLDMGVITQEEFDAKKKELLAK